MGSRKNTSRGVEMVVPARREGHFLLRLDQREERKEGEEMEVRNSLLLNLNSVVFLKGVLVS